MNQTQYTLVKLPIQKILEENCNLTLTREEEAGFLVAQGPSLLFDQIERLRGRALTHISELILVVAKKNPRQEEKLRHVLNYGFTYQGIHYSRFGKSASQAKAGITAFAADTIFDELYRITQLDIPVDTCVISKYEAQRCLLFSSCTPVKDYLPRIAIIGEYEKILKDQYIRYAVNRQREITDKETGEKKRVTVREIEEGLHDIKLSPFDGCGCHEREFAQRTSDALGLDYLAVGSQIRLPFIKGYSVYVPFREIFREMGVTSIQDIYGNRHRIEDIDCIWNVSMFKGHGLFLKAYGTKAWERYMETLRKYDFKLGISKYSHHVKDLNFKSRMNFQYLQCLDLWNEKYIRSFEKKDNSYDILDPGNDGKIIQLARYTTNLLEKVIGGDKFYTYKFLGIHDTREYEAENAYVKAVLLNDQMLKDPAVKQFLHRKLKKSINECRLGKIYADGFYHTVVGDMIGYLEYAAGKEPVGCLRAKDFYAGTLPCGKVLSFRSPLVDPSEVNDVTLVSNELTEKWFSYFNEQDLVMINMYDLSAPQQGGMDEDGDAVFLCPDPAIVSAKIHKPIIIDMEDKATARALPYTRENLTDYELMTRDSRIGEITNAATSIENKYTTDEHVKKLYEDFASLLRLFQGKEIDYLKTGLRWQMNAGLRKHLKQLPWFLLYHYPSKLETYEKLRQKNKTIEDPQSRMPLNAFRSPSPMNELCDYINTWEKKKIVWDRSAGDTGALLINPSLDLNDRKLLRQIRHAINDFSLQLKETLARKEAEKSETDFRELDLLVDTYKKRLAGLIPEEELLANYVIKVSYRNHSISKHLAWMGYGDYILANLKENSRDHAPVSITEVPRETENTYEYLGKYYLFEECENHL